MIENQPSAEGIRRFLNVGEALVIAALIGIGSVAVSTRDAVIEQSVTQKEMQKTLEAVQKRLDDVPALAARIARNEAKNDEQDRRIEQLEDKATGRDR